MAKMSNADLLSFARNELDRSKTWRSAKVGHGYDDAWRRYISLYSGQQWGASTGTDQLVVNLIFSMINVMGPAVAINNPRFVVNARKPETAPHALVAEEVLNYLWRRHDFQRDFRLSVLDWLLTGHGWLKVGYKTTKKPERKSADTVETNGNVGGGTGSEGAAEGIDDREPVEGNVESELHLGRDEDAPFVERISIFDMYVDPDARHPKEMRWIAQRTWRATPDVHVDSRYSATQRVRVSGSHYSQWDSQDGDARANTSSSSSGSMVSEAPSGGAVSYAEIIEFYDLKRGTVGTFAADAESDDGGPDAGWLIKPTDIPYATGHPFIMLRNYEVPDHFYPVGDVQQVESLQLELNETRTQMLNYRKKFRRAWTYKKDAFDRDGIRALESDEDNVMIPVQGDEDPSGVMAPVPAAITPPEFFDQSAMIQQDMEQVSGVSDYAKGAPQQNVKRTATEAAMIADASNSRSQDRLGKIEAVLADAGGRIIQLMQQYMTGDQVGRIVTLPIKGWINYDRDYIQGDFDFEVRGGSTEPRNETFRRQSALQLADISMPFVEMGVADPVALYTKLLRDGFGEKDAQRYIKAPEPPQPEAPMEQAPPEGAAPPPEMAGGMGPGGPPPPGPGPGGMPNGMGPVPEMGGPPPDMSGLPPELAAAFMGGEGAPPGMAPGLDMGPQMDPSLGPPPQELTPELLSALLAMEKGLAPSQGPPPERMGVAPPVR